MEIRGKKILITGGVGFIGSHLAAKLSAENDVWVAGRHKPEHVIGHFLQADIRSDEFLDELKKGKFDFIFHLAGNAMLDVAYKNPILDFDTTAHATLRILDTLRKLDERPKFFFVSSFAVYGACLDKKLNEDTSLTLPVSNYGVSKLAAERYTNVFSRQYGVPTVTVRIFSAYGPGLKRQIVYDFIDKLNKDPNQLEILGDGTQARDFIFINDVVDNMVQIACNAQYRGEVYNLCSGELHTTKELAELIAEAMKLKPKLIFTQKVRVFDGQSSLGDDTKMKSLGGRSNYSLKRGIEETIKWYRSEMQ